MTRQFLNKPPCLECGKAAEMGLASDGRQLWHCIACAKMLAVKLKLPAVAAAAHDAERERSQR
jgi:ribosomal protein L37AE/L43A